MTEDLNLDDGTLVISYDDNNVGIGVANPGAKLEVKNLTSGTTPTSFKIIAGTTGPDNFALQIQDYDGVDKFVLLDD